MKRNKIEIEFCEFDNIDQLSEEDKRLLISARRARENAYAPYSGYHVGSAVLLENGKIVTGSNQENAAYPSGLCAERVALFQASALYPGIAVKVLAISSSDDENHFCQTKPCGACLQVVSEYEDLGGIPIRIILDGKDSVNIIEGIDNLLPLRFHRNDLFRRKI
jgi:cytidine deaminase